VRAARLSDRSPDPCPAVCRQATDQRTAGTSETSVAVVRLAPRGGSHLNNWNVFGRLKIFDFAE
jgi:hypothetical protein